MNPRFLTGLSFFNFEEVLINIPEKIITMTEAETDRTVNSIKNIKARGFDGTVLESIKCKMLQHIF